MPQFCFTLAEDTLELAYRKVQDQFVANVGRVKEKRPPNSFFYERGLVRGKIELSQDDDSIRVLCTVGTSSNKQWLALVFIVLMIAVWSINVYYAIIVIMIAIIVLFPRTLGEDARQEYFVKEVLPQFCDSIGGTNLQKL